MTVNYHYIIIIIPTHTGKRMTTACWMRSFVAKHPAYKDDSVVTDEIAYDLVKTCDDITQGRIDCPELLPRYNTKSEQHIPTAVLKEEQFYQKKAAKQHQVPPLTTLAYSD